MVKTPWWQTAVIYQIYPRSFQDSNGDGVGDLAGIRPRLAYLAWLGVQAIWLSPIFPSPMADFGYDVSDYTGIHPLFGTLDDFDALLAAAHQQDLKVLLDFVPNHSSDRHPWFLESRASRQNPRRDWYIWRDPAPDGGPPNNWINRFGGGSSWAWDPGTGQYYLHSFLKEQPDLNWRNPELREAMLDVMRFWFERGVDGFRVDVPLFVMKDPALPDNPPNPGWREGMDPYFRLEDRYRSNTRDSHQFNRWIRAVADEYPGRVLIGETYLPVEDLVAHYGQGDEFHLPYNFQLILTPWRAGRVRALADRFEAALPPGAWPSWVLGNHDQHRIASRVGRTQARVAMVLLLTLRGTPTLYYGDELGMEDVPIPPHRRQDPWSGLAPGLDLGRDPERTPMPWEPGLNAGFCPPEVEPWLPLGEAAEAMNVAVQRQEPHSMLALTRRLLALRREEPALHAGSYRSFDAPPGVFVYQREAAGRRFLVALNFTAQPQVWRPEAGFEALTFVLSTHMDEPQAIRQGALHLRPDEGLVLRDMD